jgi:excisionase family DNA binding protein
MLGISTRTAYQILAKEGGPKTLRVGRHIRILESDLDEWFENQRRPQLIDPDGSKDRNTSD